jgi:hypothetical protein
MDDPDGGTWSREEILIYLQDGVDIMCRRTKCLFDMAYIENLPAVGNYSSDEEFELAKQIPGLILTGKRHFTREVDKMFADPGSVGPAALSNYSQIEFLDALGISKGRPTGQLPRGLVDVHRVIHDEIDIEPEFSRGMGHDIDNRYEEQGGDTDWYTLDKDGLFTLRRFPHGDGEAPYTEVVGHFGSEVSDSDYTGEVIGSWGSMAFDPEHFPMNGPWGGPTRTHPDVNNTRVEISRLNRDLSEYGYEIPTNYVKYVEYWAMARALKRDGDGQNLKMSKHYEDRFEIGVGRIRERLESAQHEYSGRMGHGSQGASASRMSIHLPYNYGRRVRRTGRY